MLDNRYIRTSADHCVYMHKSDAGSSIVAIHVDDMCAAASNPTKMANLKRDLGKLFSLVDLGEIKWLLGIAITHDRCARTISLSQAAYIEDITKWLRLQDTHPVTTPLDPHTVLSKDLGPTDEKEKLWMKKIPYLTAVSCIMYAAIGTRPDIAFAIQHLSQFNSNPGTAHWTAVQRKIRYLYATRFRSLILGGPTICLTGWVDS